MRSTEDLGDLLAVETQPVTKEHDLPFGEREELHEEQDLRIAEALELR